MTKKKGKRFFTDQVTERFLQAVDLLGANIRQPEIAEALQMTSSNLSRLKSNPKRYAPTMESCARLCDEYDVSAAWLLMGHGYMLDDDEAVTSYKALQRQMAEIEKQAAEMGKTIKSLKKKIA